LKKLKTGTQESSPACRFGGKLLKDLRVPLARVTQNAEIPHTVQLPCCQIWALCDGAALAIE
jgi:hypothetical protein